MKKLGSEIQENDWVWHPGLVRWVRLGPARYRLATFTNFLNYDPDLELMMISHDFEYSVDHPDTDHA